LSVSPLLFIVFVVVVIEYRDSLREVSHYAVWVCWTAVVSEKTIKEK